MTNEQTTDTGPAYADRVLREAILATTGGLDADQVATVVANILAPHARRRCLLAQVAIFGVEDVSIASGGPAMSASSIAPGPVVLTWSSQDPATLA